MPEAKRSIAEIMRASPVIPVLAVESVDEAVPLAQALCAGGLSVLEVTLRTDCALQAVAAMVKAVPAATIGVGTCTRGDQLEAAVDAGAQFLVSPGLTDALIAASAKVDVPLLPGVATASELMHAVEAGYDHLKFFPAESSGGVAALKALAGPFPQVRFCPTGGVSTANLEDYLALQNVLCVGGSWLAPKAAIAAGNWAEIERLAGTVSGIERPQ